MDFLFISIEYIYNLKIVTFPGILLALALIGLFYAFFNFHLTKDPALPNLSESFVSTAPFIKKQNMNKKGSHSSSSKIKAKKADKLQVACKDSQTHVEKPRQGNSTVSSSSRVRSNLEKPAPVPAASLEPPEAPDTEDWRQVGSGGRRSKKANPATPAGTRLIPARVRRASASGLQQQGRTPAQPEQEEPAMPGTVESDPSNAHSRRRYSAEFDGFILVGGGADSEVSTSFTTEGRRLLVSEIGSYSAAVKL